MTAFARIALATAAFAIAGGAAAPASAAGCNGVVKIWEWGCAPWDNNNGPRFNYYQKRAVSVPKKGTQVVVKDGFQYALRGNVYYPLIGQDGNSLKAGAPIIGNDAGSFRVVAP